MCSIGEDDFGDEGGEHAMIPDVKPIQNCNKMGSLELCNKCKKPGAIYKLPSRQVECRECFLLYTRHKFRAALGSSKVLPKDANVLLVFDGSANSVVLLDMLHHAQSQNTFKRLHCTATVLYIDDFQLIHQSSTSDEKYEKFLEGLEQFLSNYTYFDSFIVPLVNIKDITNCVTTIKNITMQKYHLKHKDNKKEFLDAIDSIKSLTSRQEFIKYHRSKLIAHMAEHFASKFAFIPDISSDLASDLLAAITLGRGGSAALDVALVDNRLGNDVKLIRPLKDLSAEEIVLYLEAQKLQPLQTKRFGLDAGSTASLQNLTKSFVDKLQENFSATVSTVFRTGDKIAVNRDLITRLDELDLNDSNKQKMHDKCCLFCNSFLDFQDSATLLAIEFSRLVSENCSTLDETLSLNVKAKENIQGSVEKTYLSKLCHACRNICMDSSNESLLL